MQSIESYIAKNTLNIGTASNKSFSLANYVDEGEAFITNTDLQYAPEAGWAFKVLFGGGADFMSDKDFKRIFKRVAVRGRKLLPADAQLQYVEKGDTMVVKAPDTDVWIESIAPVNGYIVESQQENMMQYYTDARFRFLFDTNGLRLLPIDPKQGVFKINFGECEKNRQILYLPVAEDVSLKIKDSNVDLLRGEIIITNSNNPNGVSVLSLKDFKQYLRVVKPSSLTLKAHKLENFTPAKPTL